MQRNSTQSVDARQHTATSDTPFKWVFSLILGGVLLCWDMGAAGLAASLAEAHNRQKNGPLAWVLSDPPGDLNTIMSQAHGDTPDAPFLSPDADSSGDIVIGEQLVIDVNAGDVRHIRGTSPATGVRANR